jgi:hypothetical protein
MQLPTSLTAIIWPLAFFTRLSLLRKYLEEERRERELSTLLLLM